MNERQWEGVERLLYLESRLRISGPDTPLFNFGWIIEWLFLICKMQIDLMPFICLIPEFLQITFTCMITFKLHRNFARNLRLNLAAVLPLPNPFCCTDGRDLWMQKPIFFYYTLLTHFMYKKAFLNCKIVPILTFIINMACKD